MTRENSRTRRDSLMSQHAALEHLLHVLKSRDIALGKDDVAWAFESAQTKDDIVSWSNEFLSPATLLTKEELLLYESFSGVNACPANRPCSSKDHGLSNKDDQTLTGSVLLDEDIETAISSLESSTASIEKQCRLLEAQKKALRAIQARNSSSESDQKSTERNRRLTRDRAQSEFETNELSDTLRLRLDSASKQIDSSSDGIHPLAERLLEKDDRLLDGLEKMLPRLTPSLSEASNETAELERLCQALTVLSTQEIHARIDAAYQNASLNYTPNGNGNHRRRPSSHSSSSKQSLETQREALRAELDELCREIEGLATMAVENQYRTPITRALRSASSLEGASKTEWIEYLRSILEYLTNRLAATEDLSRDLRAKSSALHTVSAAFQSIQQAAAADSRNANSPSQAHMTSASWGSPTKPSQKGLKPLRLVQANLSESHDPVIQLLRSLDVKLPAQDASAGDNPENFLTTNLVSAVQAKTAKLRDQDRATEKAMLEKIATSLAKVDGDARDLVRACFAHSKYGTVRLEGKEVRDGIDGLEMKTESLSDQMRALDTAGIGRAITEKQRELLTSTGS